MSKLPRIAVIGSGPGGLTLARILHLHGIQATVYERESHSAARPQGGSLDMHPESGQYAIEQAGLSAEFQRIARPQDQEFRVYDKYGKLQFVDVSNEGNRPEVDRGHLRQMLLDSVPNAVIRWDHELRSVHSQDDGTFGLHFKNGLNERFEVVVGADGAWSRVRPLLSAAKPIYSGVMFVELGIADVDDRHPDIASLIGHGLMFALGDSKAIIGHRDANARVGIYAALRAPEDWVALRSGLREQFDGWSRICCECLINVTTMWRLAEFTRYLSVTNGRTGLG